MKKKAALILALVLTLSMSACGAETDSGAADNDITTAAETTAKAEETEKTETEAETTTTEAETEPAEEANPLFDYYEQRNLAYETAKTNKITPLFNSNNYRSFEPIIDNDKIFYRTEDYVFYCYDITTKENKKIYAFDTNNAGYEGAYYLNNSIYIAYSNWSDNHYHLKKIDADGNEVGDFAIVNKYDSNYVYYSFRVCKSNYDGGIIINIYNSTNFEYSTTIKLDFDKNEKTEIPFIDCDFDKGHGVKEAISVPVDSIYEIDGTCYALKMAVRDIGQYYYLDEYNGDGEPKGYFDNIGENLYYLDGGKWLPCGTDKLPKEDYYVEFGDEYYIYPRHVVNLKDGSIIEFSDPEEDYYYFGGDYSIAKKNSKKEDGKWYKVQYPSDGSKVDFSKYEPLGTENAEAMENDSLYLKSGYCCPLDNTYYLFQDEVGIFLRTYENGEDESKEETIMLF